MATSVTDLDVSALGKSTVRSTVLVNPVPADHYYVAGHPVREATGAHVEVSITAGTNNADEKARFIAGAYNGITQFDHYRHAPRPVATPDGRNRMP
ncbi:MULTISPECIES: tautomerase family protein [Streptomyces]|uniref:4-oxalocrotonate tautomerase-like domain-containing protein n=3 Tax=Streptomyces avermitilis TaxID=33903 RepID=Q82P93_STRAW|nr:MULTISPECIES: tautomerase family protein [Streptomyces]MYS96672.1 hypothetical protein [Streptomyces sp. SID5469]OOV21498.1 hypothetical protein SM007_33890 [Streptomyces avermitilis]BAC68750.1 hypothetical protein SAVERM_1040 [Streptomyces avermitilis MA-4680 = NBRC 14893]GDY60705.1 hypothetical protein SAV14893_000980 [Streptomyces avermitilis]